MGRSCTPACGHRIMDDPNLTLEADYLSYDEQPPHRVSINSFSMMTQTVSEEDWAKSGLSGNPGDSSHAQAIAFAAWYTSAQDDGATYRLPTEQEWEYVRRLANQTTFIFGPREHMHDWHGVYPNPPTSAPYGGPSVGILKARWAGVVPALES